MSVLNYTAGVPPKPMQFVTIIDRLFDVLIDRPPLRHAAGIVAVGVGLLNILDQSSGLSSVLMGIYGLPIGAVIIYMLVVALSGVGLLFLPSAPAPIWHFALSIYLFLTFTGYLIGAVVGANTWAFALKALLSVGFAWWLYFRAIRRGDK